MEFFERGLGHLHGIGIGHAKGSCKVMFLEHGLHDFADHTIFPVSQPLLEDIMIFSIMAAGLNSIVEVCTFRGKIPHSICFLSIVVRFELVFEGQQILFRRLTNLICEPKMSISKMPVIGLDMEQTFLSICPRLIGQMECLETFRLSAKSG